MTPAPITRWICARKAHIALALECTSDPISVMLPHYRSGDHKWRKFREKAPTYKSQDKVVIIAEVVNSHLTREGVYDYLIDVDYDHMTGKGLRTWLPESSIQGKQVPKEPDPYAVDFVTDDDGVQWYQEMTRDNGLIWVEDLATGPEDRCENTSGDPEPRGMPWSQLCETSTLYAFKEVPL